MSTFNANYIARMLSVTNAFRLLVRLGRKAKTLPEAERAALVTNAFRLLVRLGHG